MLSVADGPDMTRTLVIGGTRFIGRALVDELLANEYDVTMLNRGHHQNPFGDAVHHIEGDRTDDSLLAQATSRIDPDVVFDCVAYKPRDVDVATKVFSDATYIYISSTHAYWATGIPKRESATRLRPCSAEQATSDDNGTYGNRKAEGDRVAFAAAEEGVDARIVRPTATYGPGDYTERFAYWVDRVRHHDDILVPGEGTINMHMVYVEDVASALRVVAEEGSSGEAYNVADRRFYTLNELLDRISTILDTRINPVHASERELGNEGLVPEDFILYRPYPYLISTEKLAALGWKPTPLEDALPDTVDDHVRNDRDGREYGPSRDLEARLINAIEQ